MSQSDAESIEIEVVDHSDGAIFERESMYAAGIAPAAHIPRFTDEELRAARPKVDRALAEARADQAHFKRGGLFRRLGIDLEDSDI